MIKPAPKTYDPRRFEQEILEWWERNNIYPKVNEVRSKGPRWFFLDGPPYASGAIHLGTALNKVIKDAILRYKTMRGFNVRKQPGWDCHGLPIEVKVEEKLGIRSKKEIEERVGVKRFIEECKRWALDHIALMTKQFKRLGVWMDWDSPYVTFTNEFIESAWWTLKRAHERGLLRMDLRVIHWCPRCETALAEHEVRGEYHERRDPSLFARFKLMDKPAEYLLIWTTTPWTLPANLAVCVHPEHLYARVEAGGSTYILAEALVDQVMGRLGFSSYKLMDLVRGKELEGLRYKHPLLEEVPKQLEFAPHHRVICGEHVTLEEGTGCVHTAPGHGAEDFEVGKRYGLPVFSPVGPDGKFTSEAGKYSGLFVKEADPLILEDLKRKGVLMKSETIVHSYPHCWRCKTPLIFRATPQWFLEISRIKPKILELNSARVKWVPDWVASRYENGVESVGDWCISRQRYWGIPLPIWRCLSCGSVKVVGSAQELEEAGATLEGVDLHRPQVDEIKLRCSCGGEMRRVPDVLDVWFDSGICSWASLGFPKNPRLFESIWPSDFITEGEDQVTKWFYSQQAASIIAFDEVPYRLVLMHGFALDAQGRKMSKSLGNVVEPEEVVKRYGADVLRFYMLSANAPWEDLKFNWRGVEDVARFRNVLWNAYVFATTYMALDNFDPAKALEEGAEKHLEPEDKWLLSRINSLVQEVTLALEEFNLHFASRALADFVLEDLSRWYIKLVRARTWIEKQDPKKLAAYLSLHQTFQILLKLLAPFMPFISETMYQGLVKATLPQAPESVHMLEWPKPDERALDEELERGMNAARAFVEAGASIRQKAGLKLRQPVGEVVIQTSTEELKRVLEGLSRVLQGQLNCKKLMVLGPSESFMKHAQGLPSATAGFGRIAIDVQLTPELKAEGLARELVRRLQTMRRDLNLEMEERVDVVIGAEAEDRAMLEGQRDYICREVRIRNLQLVELTKAGGPGYSKQWTVDGKRFSLLLQRLS